MNRSYRLINHRSLFRSSPTYWRHRAGFTWKISVTTILFIEFRRNYTSTFSTFLPFRVPFIVISFRRTVSSSVRCWLINRHKWFSNQNLVSGVNHSDIVLISATLPVNSNLTARCIIHKLSLFRSSVYWLRRSSTSIYKCKTYIGGWTWYSVWESLHQICFSIRTKLTCSASSVIVRFPTVFNANLPQEIRNFDFVLLRLQRWEKRFAPKSNMSQFGHFNNYFSLIFSLALVPDWVCLAISVFEVGVTGI